MFQETSNAVMGALLIHDVRNEDAASHPSYPLDNPLQLFQHGSFHGGIWRCGYAIGSTATNPILRALPCNLILRSPCAPIHPSLGGARAAGDACRA